MKLLRLISHIIFLFFGLFANAQINTEQVMRIGQNALYFEDYMLSIQYFNLVIQAKPEQAKPYFYRAIAKFNLEDYRGAEEDASLAIERNPFLNDVYEIRGVARQNMGKSEDAIKDYDKALQTLPRNKHILFNKAIAQEEIKDYKGSDETFKNLLKYNPKYDRAYRGLAKLRLSQGDTLNAIGNLDTALIINKNMHEAYAMRANLYMLYLKDYDKALVDMDEAIKLSPQESEYFVLRAHLKYETDDYNGALDDLSLAIEHNSNNYIAYYNRAILRTEINDINRAIDDFSVLLRMKPTDYRTLYNRAVLYKNIGEYKLALEDISKVLEVLPEFPVAHFLKYEIYKDMGEESKSLQEYDKSIALVRKLSSSEETKKIEDPFLKAIVEDKNADVEVIVAKQFSSLLITEPTGEIEQQYNNKDIRGSIQNRDVVIEPEPMFVLTYYASPSELEMRSHYIKEVDDINASRLLRFMIVVTNRENVFVDENLIKEHFESIEYYNSYISTHSPRAIDYFGRALDFCITRNYKAAIADLNKAIELTPDFALAYFLRATAMYNNSKVEDFMPNEQLGMYNIEQLKEVRRRKILQDVVADWDKLISIQPRMAIAYYNKANVLLEMHEYEKAIAAFDNAIMHEPAMGVAYYNRGYVYLKLGNKDAGLSDLSKAGELGVVPSYNLLKRMTNR